MHGFVLAFSITLGGAPALALTAPTGETSPAAAAENVPDESPGPEVDEPTTETQAEAQEPVQDPIEEPTQGEPLSDSQAPAGATTPTTWAAKKAASPWVRKGTVARVGVGGTSCTRDACKDTDAKIGFAMHAELGGRPIPYLSAGGALPIQLIPFESSGDAKINSAAVALGGFIYAHPLPFTRYDPYIGTGFGFHFFRNKTESDAGTNRSYLLRAYTKITAGLDIYVSQKIALGPRFDYFFPFSGKFCNEADDDTEACSSISDAPASFRRDFPQVWAATFNSSFHF